MITPIILSGGSGSRLWPFSRQNQPKQFLKIFDDMTLLQATIKRLDPLATKEPIIVSGKNFSSITSKQVKDIETRYRIILEPEGKNTAPAITLAANLIESQKNHLMLILSADHMIKNEKKFIEAIKTAIPVALSGKLVTFGIIPDFAFTGYGYIKKGSKLEGYSAYKIDKFEEKPDESTAQQYLESGNYLWNSGIFLFNRDTFFTEMSNLEPEIVEICKKSLIYNADSNIVNVDSDIFSQCKKQSIDYALMEHTKMGAVIPVECEWSDIGTWDTMWKMKEKDRRGNLLLNDVIADNIDNCMIRGDNRLIAVSGIEDIIIIDTEDALLIAKRDDPEGFKKIISKLEKDNRSELVKYKQARDVLEKFDLELE